MTRSGSPVVRPIQGGRGICISNTERLGNTSVDYDSAKTYKKTGFPLNPASTNLFSWLGTISKGYQLYRWKSLKITYQPIVGTSTGGLIEMGVFYDYEDYANWASDTTNNFSLSALGDFAFGPPYAGGAMPTSEGSRTSNTSNWFGVNVDVTMAHKRYPWLTVDASAPTSPAQAHDLCVGANVAFQTYIASGGTGAFGVAFVSYEIELLHPTVAGYNTGSFSLQKMLEESPDCGGPCGGFPPRKDPPTPPPKPSEDAGVPEDMDREVQT